MTINLDTKRLHIRNFLPTDSQALYEMIIQYQTSEMAAFDHQWPTSKEEIKGVAEWFAGGDDFQAVCLRETDQCIVLVYLNSEQDEEACVYNC